MRFLYFYNKLKGKHFTIAMLNSYLQLTHILHVKKAQSLILL
jgi:hypothetical protein